MNLQVKHRVYEDPRHIIMKFRTPIIDDSKAPREKTGCRERIWYKND